MKQREIDAIKGINKRAVHTLAADLGVTREELAGHVAETARREDEEPERFDPMTGPMDEEVCQ